MENKLDLLITKKYNALFGALRTLMSEKTIEEITVNELCKTAMVRRATFYKHFSDKYAFFSFMMKESLKSYMQRAEQHMESQDPHAYYIGLIRAAFDFIDENADHLTRAIESGRIFDLLAGLGSEELTAQIEQHIRQDCVHGLDPAADPAVLAQLFTGALFRVSRWWQTHQDEIEKEELIGQLSTLIRRFRGDCSTHFSSQT